MNDFIRKITSRKFWISVAAMLSSIAASIAGLSQGNQAITITGIICAVISALIYAGCEAYVDSAAVLKEAAELMNKAETEIEESEGE